MPVKMEANSMLRKTRGLLHSAVNYEVNFVKVRKDTSNVLASRVKGDKAGMRELILNINDCNK